MKIYSIVLFLVIFGSVTGAIDEIGIFGTDIAYTDTGVNESLVDEVGAATQDASWLFWIPMMIYRLGGILFHAFAGAITVIPLFMKYGVPAPIIAMIQVPIWLVYAVGIIQFVVGRSTKVND